MSWPCLVDLLDLPAFLGGLPEPGSCFTHGLMRDLSMGLVIFTMLNEAIPELGSWDYEYCFNSKFQKPAAEFFLLRLPCLCLYNIRELSVVAEEICLSLGLG